MINQLEQMTVREIFKGNSEYCIPKYQREYMWRTETCYAFFHDIKDYEAGYCLGSFICINPCPSKSNRFEIVDGQQRLILKHENKILINQGRHLEIRTDSGIRYMRSFVYAEGRKHITVMETYHPASLGRNRFQWNDLSIFRNNQS